MHQVEAPSYAAPYRGQGTKVTDCVLPTRVQGLPKPSSIIQAPWTIEVNRTFLRCAEDMQTVGEVGLYLQIGQAFEGRVSCFLLCRCSDCFLPL